MKREKGEHYVNNKEFSLAVVGYVNSTHEARAEEKLEPQIDDYIGTCFLKISEGLSRKPNFSCYTYRCLLYTSPSPRDRTRSRMPSSA